MRREQNEKYASLQRSEIAKMKSQRESATRASDGMLVPPRTAGPPTSRSVLLRSSRSVGQHEARMAKALAARSGMMSQQKPRGVQSPDALGVTNHFALNQNRLQANPREELPNPYATGVTPDPNAMGIGREIARKSALMERIAEQDQHSIETYDTKGGVNNVTKGMSRGGSPMTKALFGEMKSREMEMSQTVKRFMQKEKKKSPKRPATQASVFSFSGDAPNALRPSDTPKFIPALPVGGDSPFQTPVNSRAGSRRAASQVGLIAQ